MYESRVWLVAPFALLTTAACGPSMRTLVESDMRFEHCYRIDDDPKASLDHKRVCWSQWTQQYAKGQDRARVHYAKQRMQVLDGALAGTPASTEMATTPSPLSPYAPPPAVASINSLNPATPLNPYAPPPALAPAPPEKPLSAKPGVDVAIAAHPVCAEACTKSWRSCAVPCGAAAGCVGACDESFRGCVKTCY